MSNMSHFFILFRMRDKMASFELCVSPVLMENQHIWNFYGSLTLNKGELICIFWKSLYAVLLNVTQFDHKALFSAK